ncbi:UNVERIFIED_CONTAM: hypothetical protein GTU68_063568 [Idotea baltica]|nr:hypothetical protein [Idotea baltica]
MLIPSEFARLAVTHGTVSTISDPHEIANVLGIDGVKYMIQNGKQVPFKFHFGAPSCVPATPFETAGAEVDAKDIDELLQMDEVVYLAEMMNFPGVLNEDPIVMEKIALAKKYNKPVDGHAPGLRGDDAAKYISAGISTDHECFTAEEALDKLKHGMHILIREGSAAKNFEALIGLLDEHADKIMFCSDDKHPNNLVEGHINQLVKRALDKGNDLMKVLRASSYNVIKHYNLNVGLLQEGDSADFIVVNDLENWKVEATYIMGYKVAEKGMTNIKSIEAKVVNQFTSYKLDPSSIQVKAESNRIRVIQALDGQLITKALEFDMTAQNGLIESDVEQDVLKLVVVNRYAEAPPAVAFVNNFGLKSGALASTVAHDSHNIIAIGTNDEDILNAIHALMESKGGVSLSNGREAMEVALSVAGLMSHRDGYEIAQAYDDIDRRSRELGASLVSPYMTLSFLALLVIPDLKLSDKGLFDGTTFTFSSLFV